MHEFPLKLQHRSNPHASIVVMNADQLAEVPDEFAPDEVRKARNEAGYSVGVATAEKAMEKAGEQAQALGRQKQELADQAEQMSKDLADQRKEVERERREVDEQRQALAAQQQTLERERAEFEQRRKADQPKIATEPASGEQKPADQRDQTRADKPKQKG